MTTTRRAIQRIAASHGRGLTLLETLLASILLAMVTLAITSIVSTISEAATEQQQRLAAAELANRIMLIRVDDEENLPGETQTIAYRPSEETPRKQWRYRWRLVEQDGVRLEPSATARGTANGGTSDAVQGLVQRTKLVRVDVWLSEESDGSFTDTPLVPRATAVRLVNPLNLRNKDSFSRRYSGEEGTARLLEDVLEGSPDAAGGAPPNAAQQVRDALRAGQSNRPVRNSSGGGGP
ncbi:MAG: type II secretion system protein [Planctomycetota bacterium]